MRALILGGTREARDMAKALVEHKVWVMSSLAGRVKNPALPAGQVRIGGFGGPEGLARWIEDNNISVVIDATHPFAERISDSAQKACAMLGIPLYALHRPEWEAQAGDRWIVCANMDEAAHIARTRYRRIFLTIGRQNISAFAHDEDNFYLIRCVEKPDGPLPKNHEIIYDRGPFIKEKEKELLVNHDIDVVVTKNSGGRLTYAKIEAAREYGCDVLMIGRPPANPDIPRMTHYYQVLAQLGYLEE